MRRAGTPNPHKRAGIWYLVRRVPKEFLELDRRVLVRISTDVAVADDPRGIRARDVVRTLNRELEIYWRGLRDGQAGESRLRFEAAQKRAKALGLDYLTNSELGQGSVDEIVRRLKLLVEARAVDAEREVAAVMGGEARPSLKLSDLVDEVEAVESSALLQYSERQRRRWRVPKDTAIADLIGLIGDKDVSALNRDDGLRLRRFWQDRIAADGVQIATANKNIGRISRMLTVVDLHHQLKLEPVFRGLRIDGETTGQRAAFDPNFIQSRILAAGALQSLNEEARHLVYLIADSGLRPSEAVNLLPDTILLQHQVPHVQVRPDGRILKVEHTARDVPLVGAALAVMRLHPEGFPRYRDKADALSALVNKMLKKLDLLPTDNHTLYSLRHSFEDRLTAVEAPEKVIASLMGHKWIRPKYGAGPSLEQKQRWLQTIAFTPPAQL